MLELRIRACHVHGRFITKANKRADFTLTRRAGEPAPRPVPHRAAAGDLRARAGEEGGALAGRGEVHRGAQAQRVLRRRGRRHRHRRAGRHLQHDAARADARRARRRVRRDAGAALRDERHLSAGRQRVHPLLHRQARDADRRGRPARLHRAERQHDPAPRRLQTRVHGKDVLPMAGEYTGGVVREGVAQFLAKVRPDLLPDAAARRRGRRRSRPRESAATAAIDRATCTAGRRRSAPAARSGRSSPR